MHTSNNIFSFIPFEEDELFDLTCEYCNFQIEKIKNNYEAITRIMSNIIETIPIINENICKSCFVEVESLIENYSKLVKSVRLSIGQKVGKSISIRTILISSNYKPNLSLQNIIIHGLRNTSQHFAERLQNHHQEINHFLKLGYQDNNLSWEIKFGKAGFNFTGTRKSITTDIFDINKLLLQSYIISNKKLKSTIISIQDIWKDVTEIYNLFVFNIEKIRQEKGVECSPVRGLSIFIQPSKTE